MLIDQKPELSGEYQWFFIAPMGLLIPRPLDFGNLYTIKTSAGGAYLLTRDPIRNQRDIGTSLKVTMFEFRGDISAPLLVDFARKHIRPGQDQELVGEPDVFKGEGSMTFRAQFRGPDHKQGLGFPFRFWNQYTALLNKDQVLSLSFRTAEAEAQKDQETANYMLSNCVVLSPENQPKLQTE